MSTSRLSKRVHVPNRQNPFKFLVQSASSVTREQKELVDLRIHEALASIVFVQFFVFAVEAIIFVAVIFVVQHKTKNLYFGMINDVLRRASN